MFFSSTVKGTFCDKKFKVLIPIADIHQSYSTKFSCSEALSLLLSRLKNAHLVFNLIDILGCVFQKFKLSDFSHVWNLCGFDQEDIDKRGPPIVQLFCDFLSYASGPGWLEERTVSFAISC